MQNREFQGLVPVTVKQITECFQSGGEKSGLVINGISLTNVHDSSSKIISRFLCLFFKVLLNCVMGLVYSGLTCWTSV